MWPRTWCMQICNGDAKPVPYICIYLHIAFFIHRLRYKVVPVLKLKPRRRMAEWRYISTHWWTGHEIGGGWSTTCPGTIPLGKVYSHLVGGWMVLTFGRVLWTIHSFIAAKYGAHLTRSAVLWDGRCTDRSVPMITSRNLFFLSFFSLGLRSVHSLYLQSVFRFSVLEKLMYFDMSLKDFLYCRNGVRR
jgi:hypothetical protein